MKLTPPFPLSSIDNGFGPSSPAVQAYYQKTLGLDGHPGVDFNIPFGTPIPSSIDAVCSCVLSKDNPDPSFFRAVNLIYDDEDGTSYEIQSGHCSEIDATVGTTYTVGQQIAEVGNTGTVFFNGKEVTKAEKLAGSRNGSHCHFQVRVLKKVPASEPLHPEKHYVNDGTQILTLNGYHYEVPDWNNGYNGCVDPMQFFEQKLPSASDQVALLAAKAQAAGKSAQSTALYALASFLKSFGY